MIRVPIFATGELRRVQTSGLREIAEVDRGHEGGVDVAHPQHRTRDELAVPLARALSSRTSTISEPSNDSSQAVRSR